MPHLERPSEKYRDSFITAAYEFKAEGDHRFKARDIERLNRDFSGYVREQLNRQFHPRAGSVAESVYWLVEDGVFLGRVAIRHELNYSLREYGGHIGYRIRPSRRREGRGKLILGLALAKARELGLRRVLLTCDESNIASRKVIEANGGVLQDVIRTGFTDAPVMRWWIDLSSSGYKDGAS